VIGSNDLELSDKVDVTVLLSVKNEAANIAKCLRACVPAKEIFVVDSNSQDETCAIASSHGATVIQFNWSGGYPKKRQWALENLDFQTKWVLLLDADEVVPERLWSEIQDAINGDSAKVAYFIKKEFHFLGKRFRYGGFSHRALLLIERESCRFERLNDSSESGLDMEVHERILSDSGDLGYLATPLIHEDFKGLKSYIERHNAYSTWEAQVRANFFAEGRYGADTIPSRLLGNPQERKRFLKFLVIRFPLEPLLWFLYHYLFRLGFLHGRAGLIASRMRATYIADVRAKVYETMRDRGVN